MDIPFGEEPVGFLMLFQFRQFRPECRGEGTGLFAAFILASGQQADRNQERQVNGHLPQVVGVGHREGELFRQSQQRIPPGPPGRVGVPPL